MKYAFLLLPLLCLFNCAPSTDLPEVTIRSDWSDKNLDRPWAGPNYWAAPLQAWRQFDGKLRCESSGGDRKLVLLTHTINHSDGEFAMSIDVQALENKPSDFSTAGSTDQAATDGSPGRGLDREGWVGFQVGLKGDFDDYRDDAVKGIGLCAGMTQSGRLFIGDLEHGKAIVDFAEENVTLEIIASIAKDEMYNLTLICHGPRGGELDRISRQLHRSWLPGLIALSCSQSVPKPLDYSRPRAEFPALKELNKAAGGQTRYAFSNWKISGTKFDEQAGRTYGPILWAQHTLSDSILKMSVQFAPLGNDLREVIFLRDSVEMQRAVIDSVAQNALFRIEGWDTNKTHNYQIRYTDRAGQMHVYEGEIRAQPTDGKLRHAALSCVDDRGFPHQDLVDNVAVHQPHLLSFHGDQLYERVGGYGVERNSKLDYLRKWYIFGWSFGELMRNTPTIIIPDDHDVFHGNIWGEGGKAADVSGGYGYDAQDSGGYKEPADFVNMVHRTQTSHLPDPDNPTPVLQDISVYYTNLNYGGVSFAILGDRQWKSAPKPLLPKAEIENGWPQNRKWNAKTDAYHPTAELLGDRQEAFLERWVADWAPNIYFKTVISQSPFCNVATLPADIYHDKHVPKLPRYKPGEYPTDDRPVADFDSNGWPQNKRDLAVRTIRKAFALHVTGDQHLGSTGRYGVDEYGDSGYWISSPAVSNLWPRRWFPAQAATSGKAADDQRRYTGDYEDGFGNRMTVMAIANPHDLPREPAMIYDKAPGYAIIDYDLPERRVQLSVWPRWASPVQFAPDNEPFPGWPITIEQQDNFGKKPLAYLPEIEVDGDELVRVVDKRTGELVYALRPKAGTFKARVFGPAARFAIERER